MIKLATQDKPFFSEDLKTCLRQVRQMGFDGFEADGALLLNQYDELKAAVKDTGVPVTSVCGGYRGWIGDFVDYRRKTAIEDIKIILERAGEIGAAGIVVGLIMELFLFAVDYSRTERFEYEDDEYHYYVKAIPKLSVATPEKTVKRINERKETEIINTAEVRRKHKAEHRGSHRGGSGIEHRGGQPARRQTARRSPSVNSHDMNEVDKRLLTQSLKHDLDLK